MSFIVENLVSWILNSADKLGYGGAFLFSILDRVSVSLIPTEVLLPLYGFLIGRGVFYLWPIFIIISFGALAGELILYVVFAKGGRPFLEKYGKYILIKKHDLEHLDRLFAKHGVKLVFWGRFLPLARSIVAIPAGVSRLSFKKFAVYSFFGMMPYNLFLLFLGKKTGENFYLLKPYFDVAEKIAVFVLAVFVFWYIYRHLKHRHATH